MNFAILAGVAALAPTMVQAETLELVCRGTANAAQTATSTVNTNIDDGWGGNQQATIGSRQRVQTPATLRVRIQPDGTSQALVPSELIPSINSFRANDWRAVTEFKADETHFRGKVKFNPFYGPTFEIDRRTGEVELQDGGAWFRGQCEKAPDKGAPNKF